MLRKFVTSLSLRSSVLKLPQSAIFSSIYSQNLITLFRVVIVKNFIQRNKEVLLKFESKVLSTFGLDFTGDAMRLAEIFSVLMGLKRKKTEHFGHQIVQNSTKCATIKTQSIGNDWVKKSKGVDTMAYTAMQIAAEVVRQYHEKGKSITNLKLQKVLYYIQVKCLQKNGVPAFEDNIEAWRHGPVVRDVYNAFCAYIANPISDDDPDVTKNQVKIDDFLNCDPIGEMVE